MQYYQELTLIDQAEISLYFIWSKLYTQLHLAFVEQQDAQEKISFGVSFPQYRINEQKQIGFLGSKIRVFAKTEDELQQLNLAKWLDRLMDYIHFTSPRAVPQDQVTGYACYSRVRKKDSVEQRITHQAKRRNISIAEAAKHFEGYVEQPCIEPFISLTSSTTKQTFKLNIAKKFADEANNGQFGTYGLSDSATVPEF